LRPNQPALTAIRLDKFPTSAQKNIIRLLQHTHFIDFPSPGIWGLAHPKDIFLQQPEVEADHNYSQQAPQTQYDHPRQIMPPQPTQQQAQGNLHQQQMFSPDMRSGSQMPPTPATPSERPLVSMGQQMVHQSNMMSNMSNQGPPMSNSMHSSSSNMNISQQPPPSYMSQANSNQMPKMHPHQMMPPSSSNSMMQMGMGQPGPVGHQQMGMDRAQPPAAPVNRGGRRKSNTGQAAATGGGQRGQKRKKDSKTNLFQAPEYNAGNQMPQMQNHPSTAQFPVGRIFISLRTYFPEFISPF
jgi:hypothetical protein